MFGKVIIIFLILSLALFSLVACGEESTEETADDLIEITVAGGAIGQQLELTQDAAERYNDANSGVNVRVIGFSDIADDRRGLYSELLESESSKVDIMQIDLNCLAELESHFLDLYQYGAEKVADQHFASTIEDNTIDGQLLAIPWFTNLGLLYHEDDLLKQYDLNLPETWSELKEAVAKLDSWHLAVSKYSEEHEVAADVALFMASYEEQKLRAIEGALAPSIKELYQSDVVLEQMPYDSFN